MMELRGVRVHNLKSIDVTIPWGQVVAVTGVSGSGKSSLAFDTLFAEGQRRYLESLSPHARQFLEQLPAPDADHVDPLPPAVAVRQNARAVGPRSTVGTATELAEYLRLLFANVGQIRCPGCQRIIRQDTPQDVLALLVRLPAQRRFQIAFPQPFAADQTEETPTWREALIERGFTRVILAGNTINLQSAPPVDLNESEELLVVVDRLATGQAAPERILDSVELAFAEGQGRCVVLIEDQSPEAESITVDGKPWTVERFNDLLQCDACKLEFLKPEPRLFNPNVPAGACPACNGQGTLGEDSLATVCPRCAGTRLRPEALAVHVGEHNCAEVGGWSLTALHDWIQALDQTFSEVQRRLMAVVLSEMATRLTALGEMGLDYLTLDRRLPTLSAGESQRVALARTLGHLLVNALYVLDEPSAGLHPADCERVLGIVRRLQQADNTVIIVEHEDAFLKSADYVIDLGPGAGRDGGRVVFQGPPEQLAQVRESATGRFLAGQQTIQRLLRQSVSINSPRLKLSGARAFPLKNLTVEFPLGCLCVVTGVSGSGKTVLIEQVLYPALQLALEDPLDKAAQPQFDRLEGGELVDDVLLLDQSPLTGRSRSNPMTYLKAFDDIRRIFAESPEAKLRGFQLKDFSFNASSGGRCPRCLGQGIIDVDMQFLADVQMVCPECGGSRYQREILQVRYRGLNVAEVLALTVAEAFPFFRTHPRLQRRLQLLKDVGLEYLPLGQPTATLSGGELQRLKLASFLTESHRSRTLFLLDEPTSGLHPADVQTLLNCFDQLLMVGHSLIVVEHNSHLIHQADWVIDLGPGADANGGQLLAAGPPDQIAENANSITGRYLGKHQ